MAIPNDVLTAKRAISARFLRPLAVAPVAYEHSVAIAAVRASHTVHAVGVGMKRVSGKETAAPSVRVYVEQKLPLSLVPADERIPSHIDGIPTDVIESAPALLMSSSICSEKRQSRLRPLLGGISGALSSATAGTIACVCLSIAEEDDPALWVCTLRDRPAVRTGLRITSAM